jgi:hypothetical protein
MIVPKLNITGKGEIIPYLQQQEEQAQATQAEATNIQHAFDEMKLKELMSKAVANIAMAKERHGRSESDIGLFEERLSMITKNRASATKEKMEALEKLIDVIERFGEIEANLKLNELESFDYQQIQDEDREKADAKATGEGNEFMMQLMGQMSQQQQGQKKEQMQGQDQMQQSQNNEQPMQ